MGNYQSDADWEKMETAYITTSQSYRALAEQFGLSVHAVANYGKAHNWTGKRKEYRAHVVEQAVAMAADRDAGKLAKLISAADKASEAVERALADEKQLYRYIITEKTAEGSEQTNEYIFNKTDTKALRNMVACLKDLTAVIRNVNNLPTAAEQEARAIQQEKLALEKKKSESVGAIDRNITVTFSPIEEESE